MNKNTYFVLCAAFFALLACGCSAKKNSPNVIKVAATPVPQGKMLAEIAPDLEKQGYTLQVIIMDDYNLPNRALADKEVDANFFQHIPFLEAQKKQFHYDICSLAAIHIEPMGAYSSSIKTIDAVADGAVVAVPSDPSNEARALLLLQENGLVTLKENAGYNLTVRDITSNPKKLKILEVDAATLARVLPDVSFAIIPTNFALQASLSPSNALFLEKENSPYVNIIAVRCEDMTEPKLLALKEAMTSEKMKEFINKQYGKNVVPAFTPALGK